MRNKSEWQTLIKEQQKSGQTATAFCKERGVNPKYFSLKKKQLETLDGSSNFIRVVSPTKVAGIVLSVGASTIHLPADCSTQWLADLVRALR